MEANLEQDADEDPELDTLMEDLDD